LDRLTQIGAFWYMHPVSCQLVWPDVNGPLRENRVGGRTGWRSSYVRLLHVPPPPLAGPSGDHTLCVLRPVYAFRWLHPSIPPTNARQ